MRGMCLLMIVLVGLAGATVLCAQDQPIPGQPPQWQQPATPGGGVGPGPGFGGGPGPGFGGGGPGFGQRPMSEAEMAKFRQEMMERMLDGMGLSATEKSAVKKSLEAKNQAREALATSLGKLRNTAALGSATDKDITTALASYRAALATYNKAVQAQDAALAKKLSPRSQVQCITMGLMDSAGMMGMGMGPGGRMGGRTGAPRRSGTGARTGARTTTQSTTSGTR